MKNYEINTKNKYLLYTLCYLVIVIPIIIKMIPDNVAIGGGDGITQHYPAMLYISRTIREVFKNLISERTFIFPMYEWTLGMGENVISTLNWYGYNDPFYLFSAFFTENQLPYFYTFLFYIRVYLGGMTSILLFNEIDDKNCDMSYVVAALVYTFSGFTLQCNIHIIFTHAMMYIPLMFFGTERIIKKKRPIVLGVSVLIFALSGFYYLYIASIAIAIYVIYRLVTLRMNLSESLKIIKNLLVEYLLGIGLSAVIFIPEIVGFFNSSRGDVEFNIKIFNKLKEIEKIFVNIFFPNSTNQQVLSISVIAIISVIWLCLSKGYKTKKITLLLLLIVANMPIVSWIMSGFSLIYDRWHIVIVLYISYLTMIMWQNMHKTSTLQKIGLVIISILLIFYGKWKDLFDNYRYKKNVEFYIIITFAIIVLFTLLSKMNKSILIKCAEIFIFTLVVWSVSWGWNEIDRETPVSAIRYDNVINELIDDKEQPYRIDYEKTFGEPRMGMNLSFVHDYKGISQYFSIENRNYVDAFWEWETYFRTFNNGGLDQRAILETLAGVKYFVVRSQNNFIVPYGFDKIKSSTNNEWELYENKYALPMMYAYTEVFDSNVYNNMSGLDKQQVMLQAAAIEQYEGEMSICDSIKDKIISNLYEIEENIKGEIISVKPNDTIVINALLKANSENYLLINRDIDISVKIGEDYEKYREPITLGRVEQDKIKKIEIKFYEKVELNSEDIKILSYDFDEYEEYIYNLKEGIIEDTIKLNTNQLKCSVDFDEKKILCIAVPYDKGWHATIDGKDVEIYKINSMYMGIEVPIGWHDIELNYVTPGIKIGFMFSVFSLVIVIIILYKSKLKGRLQLDIDD